MKPDPVMVIVNEGPPAGAVLGLSVVMTGGGTVITKLEEFDIMLPGFVTVTFAVPIFATSDAGTAAVNCVEEINVVGNAVPFQLTTEPVTNPDPLTVRVKLDAELILVDVGSVTTVRPDVLMLVE